MSKILTTEEFIKRAKMIHGDKYNYDKVDYKGADTKVCIICPEHGEFWQTPNSHLSGSDCPKCAVEQKAKQQSSLTEEFVAKAKKAHGDKYDYSKVVYKDAKTKVHLVCPKHGEFLQIPNNLLNGWGCPKCSEEQKELKGIDNTEDFIAKAKETHGNKYDYSKVIYTNSRTKVDIICPKHGEFWQMPYSHLNNHGCPICAVNEKQSKLSAEEAIASHRDTHVNEDNYEYAVVAFPKGTSLEALKFHADGKISKHRVKILKKY